ncbi:hypothetical protein LR066_02150 [candidate division WOR-3 bacterium]|nr:hypothetical protein [candidate division WOR-3 bacterium]
MKKEFLSEGEGSFLTLYALRSTPYPPPHTHTHPPLVRFYTIQTISTYPQSREYLGLGVFMFSYSQHNIVLKVNE